MHLQGFDSWLQPYEEPDYDEDLDVIHQNDLIDRMQENEIEDALWS